MCYCIQSVHFKVFFRWNLGVWGSKTKQFKSFITLRAQADVQSELVCLLPVTYFFPAALGVYSDADPGFTQRSIQSADVSTRYQTPLMCSLSVKRSDKNSSRKSKRWPHSLLFILFISVFLLFSSNLVGETAFIIFSLRVGFVPSCLYLLLSCCHGALWWQRVGLRRSFNGYIDPETQYANTVLSARAKGRRGQAAGDAGKEKPCAEYLISTHHFLCVCFLFPVKGFETEEQFERFVQTDPHSENVLAAVVFEHPFTHDDEPLPLKVKGRLRLPFFYFSSALRLQLRLLKAL